MKYKTIMFLMCSFIAAKGYSASYPDHRGESPWNFDAIAKPSDSYVVNDADGSTIDRYLSRRDGDIVIQIPIRKYVGETDGNGFLVNSSELVQRGMLSRKLKIFMPAFDVDKSTFPVGDCDGDDIDDQLFNEVNHVYFNDEQIGELNGENQKWFQQKFNLPIDKLKFPSQRGGTAINEIRIKVDVANKDVVLSSGAVGCFVWRTAIDWVGIQYEATPPVVLVHGIRSEGAVWENFMEGLTNNFVESDNRITFETPAIPDPLPENCANNEYNDNIDFNINQLLNFIPQIATEYGSGSLNFVGHSKGGLDSRGFLNSLVQSPIEIEVGRMSGQPVLVDLDVKSLITLNTPHKGSVFADYGVEARSLTATNIAFSGNKLLLGGVSQLEGPYYCDLTPQRVNEFIANTTLPDGIQTASVATDADNNDNRELEGVEGEGFYLDSVATLLYETVGSVSSVDITVTPSGDWYIPDFVNVIATPTVDFMFNDIIVTQDSASLYSTYNIDDLNHLNVHATTTAQTIATDAQSGGIIDWRVKQ